MKMKVIIHFIAKYFIYSTLSKRQNDDFPNFMFLKVLKYCKLSKVLKEKGCKKYFCFHFLEDRS